MIHIIVSGAGGQLGKAFVNQLHFQNGYAVYSFDRGQLDIADADKIKGVLHTLPQAQYWINCAAYTKVDDAESHPDQAHLYNGIAPGHIASACRDAGVHVIDFSSDYVYHNVHRRPLREDDPTEPKGVYAKSKLEGERTIAGSGASYTVLRTSWVYGPGGHNFVNTMLRLGKQRDHFRIVGDQTGAPTFTLDIVEAVRSMIHLDQSGRRKEIQGIFNFANAGEVTWADFARTIFQMTGMNCAVENITTAEYGAPAPRPAYSVLDCSKISGLLDFPIPHWQDALKRYLSHELSS